MSAATQTAPAAPPVATFKQRRAAQIEAAMKKYPVPRSALMPVLWMIQEEQGWISAEAMEVAADICGVLPAEAQEMVTFYTMYNREPVGKFVLRVCNTLPCALCGSEGLIDYLKEKLGVGLEQMTEDGLFTIKKVECLGACSEAPLMLVNKKVEARLTRKKVDELIARCRGGERQE